MFSGFAKQIVAALFFAAASGLAPRGYGDAPARLRDIGAPRPFAVVPAAERIPEMSADPDDPAWKSSARLALKNSSNPDSPKNSAASVQLLWDSGALYLRYRDSGDRAPYHPYSDSAARLRFDDCVETLIDFGGDSQHWVEIIATPKNEQFATQADLKSDPESDSSFRLTEGVVQKSLREKVLPRASDDVASRLTSDGWIIDIRIAASEISQSSDIHSFSPNSAFRANFIRERWFCSDFSTGKMNSAQSAWSSVQPNTEQISPASMGYLRLSGKPLPAGESSLP